MLGNKKKSVSFNIYFVKIVLYIYCTASSENIKKTLY